MITNEEVQNEYIKARDALNEIADSDEATDKQIKDAISARKKLTIEFIGKQINEIEKLTKQYKEFIKDMEDVARKIKEEFRGPLEALGKIQGVIDGAAEILKE